ncbi:MAG: hypothetical protein ACFE9L_06825 [Candidatus Hodarchaeota archaeon]
MTSKQVRFISTLEERLGQTITLVGFARTAKAGPVLITLDNQVVYVKGIDFWSSDLVDKRISVIGLLKKEKFIPQSKIDENGAISSGAMGLQYVLELQEFTKVSD